MARRRSTIFWTPLLAMLVVATPVRGQAGPATVEEQAVLAAAQALLDVINTRDGERAREILLPDGALVRVIPTAEGGEPQAIPHRVFAETIAGPGAHLFERMWAPKVMIHGPIAMVWATYEFFTDGEFSHCGINAFSLVRDGRDWKVAGVVYTVEQEGCPPGPIDSTDGD